MSKSLEDHDPSEPAVDQVESVVGNLQKLDEGVVSSRQEDERNQVDRRHSTGPVTDNAGDCVLLGLVGNGDNAYDHVQNDDCG